MHPTLPRIVVSGLGAITPLGFSVAETWQGLLACRSAVGPLDLFPLDGLACAQAGQIHGLAPLAGSRAIAFAMAACREALGQAQSEITNCELRITNSPVALIAATNFGAMDHGEKALTENASPVADAARNLCPHAVTDLLAATLGLTGPRATLTLSCAAGAAALAHAASLIRHNRAERVLVVGYDALSRFAWSGLCALRTMTRDRVRPFDCHRSGTIFSEGAAALLLESDSACRARGGTPLAELLGWSTNNNGFHMAAPAPHGAGTAQAMRQALACADLLPEAVDHINAHGTATQANDLAEAQAIAAVFGPHTPRIPVTSIKSSLGHMLGAAGTIEAIASILSLREGVIPPTTNFETPDPDCRVNLVANQRQEARLRHVLSNSAGIGGGNAVVILGSA